MGRKLNLGQRAYLREMQRWARDELVLMDHEKEQRTECEKNHHPKAVLGGEYAPPDHFYCKRCKVIFYDDQRPAYRAALKRGNIKEKD